METPAGWAFLHIDGYLGSVTEDGQMIAEEQFLDTE
jgi:hypothetical protein